MTTPKIYLPLLDNGNGDVKANFLLCREAAFKGYEVVSERASDSHADRGMNKIANAFLKSDCDVWINLDADIHFTRADVENLLSHEVPLVYGVYPKKQDDTPPCVGTFETVPVANNLATLRRCGRGFMLVRRSLLLAMKEEYGGPALRYHNHGEVEWNFFESGPVMGAASVYPPGAHDADGWPLREWISEDWMFCERARGLGVPTLVDTRIALGHEGSKVYRFGSEGVVRRDWQNVPGWFSEADAETYRRIAHALPEGGQFAEIGCWMGRSLCALVEFLHELGKGAGLHAIDTFKGTQSEPCKSIQAAEVERHGGSLRAVFEANLKAFGGAAQIYEMESLKAAEAFRDGSLDAVFIDGNHRLEAVRADLAAWIPKVKVGGIIAGHDYDEQEVKQAVDEEFACDEAKVEVIGRCWFVQL
jgi:hypothetical protein